MIKSKSKTNSPISKVIPKPIDDKESKCFNCGKRGHLSRECRFKDLGKKCFNCNSFGHIANQCPTRSNANALKGRMYKDIKINDQLQALIDTGCQLNLIRIDQYLAIGSSSFDADNRFISGIGNKRVKLLGKFKADVKIDDVLFVTIFNIVPEDSMKVEVIIGDEMLKEVHFSVVGCIVQHPRRNSQKEAQEVDAQIDEWLKQGIIQRSNSEYASPNVLVKKKNGKTRICGDYRKLSKETVKDRYPLPLIEDQIDKLQAARLFSTIDLKTCIFSYSRIVLTYLDDIVIPANDAEEAFKHLKHVLKRAEEYGLQINWEKCQILKSEITYLGHEIKDGVIRPSNDKVAAVKRFLGLTGYFRKFIKNYSIIVKPLSDMLKTNANFMMGPDQKQAFKDLKHPNK
ncbi:hypothetical protein LAZ67_15001307 [Cordylochernes scorpioides]|uniref:CCHC-type domain-containing protein n=1 Tax=Cordylochernes scorpioides TaxID=51811 RepID=A0ABY6L8N9_9ARAC|nr:hypothetical protein LAZ67_15001307 [Cordylochernes scorpioides]